MEKEKKKWGDKHLVEIGPEVFERVIGEKKYPNFKTTTIQLNKQNNKLMTQKEVQAICDSFDSKFKGKKINIGLRGLNEIGYRTLKSFEGNIDYDDEYYAGKVADPSHFSEFYQLHLTIRETINKK